MGVVARARRPSPRRFSLIHEEQLPPALALVFATHSAPAIIGAVRWARGAVRPFAETAMGAGTNACAAVARASSRVRRAIEDVLRASSRTERTLTQTYPRLTDFRPVPLRKQARLKRPKSAPQKKSRGA